MTSNTLTTGSARAYCPHHPEGYELAEGECEDCVVERLVESDDIIFLQELWTSIGKPLLVAPNDRFR